MPLAYGFHICYVMAKNVDSWIDFEVTQLGTL